MQTYQLYFLCAFGLAATSDGAPIAGPYIAYGEVTHACEGQETTSFWRNSIKISRFNPKEPFALQTINGNTTILHDLDDTFWLRARFDSRSSNNQRWVKNALLFNFPVNGCSSLRKHASEFFVGVFGRAFLNSNPCVIKEGVYIHDNSPINITFPKFPVLPYGHYRIQMNMGVEQKSDLVCLMTVGHVIPLPKRLQNV